MKKVFLFLIFCKLFNGLNCMQIIILNGVSCSGKSSIANELAELNKSHYTKIFSIDTYMHTPHKGTHRYRKEYAKVSLHKLAKYADLFDNFHIQIYNETFWRVGSRTPVTIIIDHSIKDKDMFLNLLFWLRTIPSASIKLIKISCSLETALARCTLRNQSANPIDHREEKAVRYNFKPDVLQNTHDKEYDVQILTDSGTPKQLALLIQASLATSTAAWGKNKRKHEDELEEQYDMLYTCPAAEGMMPDFYEL